MAYKDLRGYLQQVEAMGELLVVEGADRDVEIGAITEVVRQQNPRKPAIIFDKIKGFPQGYRVLSGIANTMKRLLLITNLPLELSDREFVSEWRKRLNQKEGNMLPPRVVDSGPVMENVLAGDDIDMLKFPAPMWHEHDGGRYLGTASAVITRDPDQGWVNLGTYRVMVHDAKTVGFYISPGKQGRIHREKYWEKGEPCPVAISFGHDPLLFLAATMQLPYGTSELNFAGGIKGEPIDVIRGEVTGLPIPAASEIVIEGFSYPNETRNEGPFGEFTGYYASQAESRPFIRVERVYYRNNPIITGSSPGRPPGESTLAQTRLKSAAIWNSLERAGVPDVQGVCCHEAGTGHFLTAIALKQRYPGHAKQAGVLSLQAQGGAYMGRFAIVVDEDIDPFDLEEVLWAMCTRCDPAEGIDIMRRCWSGPLDPAIHPDRKGFNSRAVIDACRPYSWKDRFPKVVDLSSELRQQTLEQWGTTILK